MTILNSEKLMWFPMRVTYNREMKMKDCFDQMKIENFLPMRYEIGDGCSSGMEKLVPAIHNLIFVRSNQDTITELKMSKRELSPLRYMMRETESGKTEIMTVPEKEMDDFIRVASVKNDSVFYVDASNYINKIGKKVRITSGQFKDVVGVIKRIKNNKCVVVRIEGIAAVAIAYIPARFLEEIS